MSPHHATAAARTHTKDGPRNNLSAFGDGAGGSSAGAPGGRGVDCLRDHLFSVDGQPSQQTISGAPVAVDTGSDAKRSDGRGDFAGTPDDMLACFKADAEGQWAAVAKVARAGLGDEDDDELLAYNGEHLRGV